MLYFFSGGNDGGTPSPQLIVGPDGALYGTTPTFNEALDEYGGGTVFRVDLTGVETVLYSFPYAGNATTDPSTPIGIILASDGNFYGTSGYGGANHAGTLFRVTMSGAETVVYSFAGGSDGQIPSGAPIEGSDGNFYGTTQYGGTTNSTCPNSCGTVYKVSPTGTEEVILAFAGPNGFQPYSSLVQAASGQLYGSTLFGGDLTGCPDEGCGVMLGVSTSGVQTFLYQFTYSGGGPGPAPVSGADGNLYAVTSGGGAFSNGTMFSLTPDGVVTTLHAFGGNLQ